MYRWDNCILIAPSWSPASRSLAQGRLSASYSEDVGVSRTQRRRSQRHVGYARHTSKHCRAGREWGEAVGGL